MSETAPQSAADLLLDPRACALLLWDLQVGLAGQSAHLPELLPVWLGLRSAALEAGVLVVRSRHIAAPPRLMDPVTRWRITRRTHGENRPDQYMQPGGADTAWVAGTEPGPTELVIEKAAPSLFHNTAADARLRAAGVRTLVIAGVATEQGVDLTSRHAQIHGYFTVIVEDGVASYSDEAHAHGMALLRRMTYLASSEEILTAWAGDERGTTS